ncbi:MAG: LysR family transcriptional regulator [Gammaproteobacteria bacterium]|nr:LysR family transcriptional regulator [Gammaproteobacteria bacterium]
MHVTLRQLKVFQAVARHLNYSKAAEVLFLTQPAVSMQIKQLEDNCGMPLFEQIGKRIYLTDAGKEFEHYCRIINAQLDELDTVFEELKGVERGHLHLSVASTANPFCTHLLAEFRKRVPHLTVSLDVTNRKGLIRQLEYNETELVVMGQPPDGLDVDAEPFMENPLVVIAPPDHRLARERSIPLERLQDEPFVVREQSSGTRISMERFFDDAGIRLQASIEMRSNEALQQAVQAGLGLGIVSRHTLELELETHRLVILDVERFPIMRQWYLVHRTGKYLTPIARAFREFMLNEANKLWKLPA